jgi:hypothetical protein
MSAKQMVIVCGLLYLFIIEIALVHDVFADDQLHVDAVYFDCIEQKYHQAPITPYEHTAFYSNCN